MKPGERIHFPVYDSHPTHSCLWERRQQVPSSAILSPLSVTHERRRIQGVLIITGSSSQTTSPLPPLLPMTTYHKNILYYRYHDRKKMKKKTLAFSNPPPPEMTKQTGNYVSRASEKKSLHESCLHWGKRKKCIHLLHRAVWSRMRAASPPHAPLHNLPRAL